MSSVWITLPTLLHLQIFVEVGPSPRVGAVGLKGAGGGDLKPWFGALLPSCARASHTTPLPPENGKGWWKALGLGTKPSGTISDKTRLVLCLPLRTNTDTFFPNAVSPGTMPTVLSEGHARTVSCVNS